jgi:3-oxoacyl-[acyl-carrier protein] reductase
MPEARHVALVAGRGTAVERACAQALSSDGYSLVTASTSDQAWSMPDASQVGLVGGPPAVPVAVGAALAVHGRLDALVVFDPATSRGPLAALQDADWERDLGRLQTSIALASAFARVAESGAGIVLVTTIDHAQAYPGRATAAATSSAIVGVCRAMAVEWALRPIRVNVVATGVTPTDAERDAIAAGDASLDRVLLRAPGHRLGTPEETAQVVRFLLSDQAAFITGQSIAVDGGWTALTQHAEGLRFP